MPRLVFVDANVLIAAARGKAPLHLRAMQVLDDPDLRFASSLYVQLEILPKALYNRQTAEAAFYNAFFQSVVKWAEPSADLVRRAYAEASKAGLSALDALHITAAASVGAEELVTAEKASSTIHRSTLVPVRTIIPE